MRSSQALLAAALSVAGAVVMSGCGSSNASPGVASLASGTSTESSTGQTTTTPPSRQDFQTAILAYTRCMRANGVQMADPTFNGGGGGGGGGLFRLRADRNNPKFRKAQAKCGAKLAAIRPQFTPAQQQQFQATALKFAQCMRKNGVDVPDPDFSQGAGPGGGLFGANGINPRDPKVRKAFQTCQKVFTGNGPGGFRFGGPPGGGPPPGGGSQ